MSSFLSQPASVVQQHPPLVQPIVFCGPGNNLYPLCSNSSSSHNDLSTIDPALPKALLPILNRPMIAYPLQQILSAGLRYAYVLAPSEQHHQIATALKSLILIPPPLTQTGKKASSAAAVAAAAQEASRHSNVSVVVGLSNMSSATNYTTNQPLSVPSSAATEPVMRVELLPLGPQDTNSKPAQSKKSSKLDTAQLISWLYTIGKLERDPLIVPLDFIGQGIPLTTLINSHVTGVPEPPMMTGLMYERGAGEGTGKEREKDGPPKLFTAYDRTPLSLVSSSTTSSNLSLHRILLLQDSDDVSDIDSSDLHVRMSLLWSHPHVRISTSLLDSHIYIFHLTKLITLLQSKKGEKIKSLREHVVPFIAKCSWMKGLREKAGWHANSMTTAAEASRNLSGQASSRSTNATSSSSSAAAAATANTATTNTNTNTSSYVPWTMQASKEENGGVRRSTTFVEPDLLQGGSSGHSYMQSTLLLSPGSSSKLDAQSPPLFTPDMSRAPSPRTKETAHVGPSPSTETGLGLSSGQSLANSAVDLQTQQSKSKKSNMKLLAKKSAQEARCVVLIVRLSKDRKHPIEPGMTIEEVKENEGISSDSEMFVARANTVPAYIECNRYLLRSLSSTTAGGTTTGATPSSSVSIIPEALPYPLPNQSVSSQGLGALSAPLGVLAVPAAINSAASDSGSTGVSATNPVGPHAATSSQLIDAKAQVSNDSLVGDHTRIAERAMVKRSAIGCGCVIGKHAKITGCIIMDGVRIGESVKLENCIVCPQAVIEDRANLKDCDVATQVTVTGGTSSKNEKFDE